MENNMVSKETNTKKLGPIQFGIILLTLATAVIHGIVLNILMQTIDPLFTLNGIGYLALLAGLYLPIPIAKDNRSLVRWLLIGYTAITILAWVVISWPGDALGQITKLFEVILIALLLVEGRSSRN